MELIKLYGFFFKINLKRLTIYRADFFLNFFAMIIWAGAGLVEVWILFQNLSSFSGWSSSEVFLLYGLWSLTFALYNAFGHGIMDIEKNILSGKMDTLLTKPLDPLYLLLTSHLNTMGLGMFALGITVTTFAAVHVDVQWSLLRVLFLMVSTLAGGVIIFSVYFVLASLSFWHGKTQAAIRIGYDVHMFAKYPVTIYGKAVQFLLIFVFPYAFTNYIPVAVLTNKLPAIYGALPIVVAAALLWFALKIWSRGLQKYESAN